MAGGVRWGPGGRALLVALALITVLVGSAGPSAAASPYDLRGAWDWALTNLDCKVGTTCAPLSEGRLTITRQDPRTGTVTGTWKLKTLTWRVSGRVSGDQVTLALKPTSKDTSPGTATGTLTMEDGVLVLRGELETPGSRAGILSRLVRPVAPAGAGGGTRPSATFVMCDRDLTTAPEDALLECTAMVADASAQPDSTTPTGTVSWTADVGAIAPGSCQISQPTIGGTAWCAVTLRGTAAELPLGVALPVTASYAGDTVYRPSEGSPDLYGGPTPDVSEELGEDCNPAWIPAPTTSCGDPIDPATGNLALTAVDLAVGGRGPGLFLTRTYNALVSGDRAATTGRFGAGWSDCYGARAVREGDERVTIVLGSGATVPFTAAGKRWTPPTWVSATLVTGPRKGLVLTFADGGRLTFDRSGRLLSIDDRTAEPVRLSYADDGTLAAATDASGRSLTFTSDAAGRITGATDPAGRTVAYAYDDAGDLVTFTDVTGGITRYAYRDHRLVSVTTPDGASATMAYDAQGRVTQQVDPLGGRLALEYRGAFPDLVTMTTDGTGARRLLEHHAGVLVREVEGYGGTAPSTTHHRYDEGLRLAATIDPLRDLWRLERDAAGNVTRAVDPLGNATTATWTDHHDPLTMTTPMGVVTAYRYDDRGLLTGMTVAAGTPAEASIGVAHDDPDHPGDVTSITDPMGATTTWTYDAHGDPVRVTDALGGARSATYDILGQILTTTDPLGATTTLTRDIRGDVIAVTDATGATTTMHYDAVGRLTALVDALGAQTSVGWDAAGRPMELSTADGSSASATRDPIGNLLAQTDPLGATSASTWDDHGRPTSWTDPLGNTWELAWDLADRLASTRDPDGLVTTPTYDAAGRLVGLAWSDGGPPVTFVHDADGRRIAMTDGSGTSTDAYDERGRLVRATDGAGRVRTFTWDADGRLLAQGYPDGPIVERTYDALGRQTAIADGLGHTSRFTWDAAGRLSGATLGNGVTTTWTWDAVGRPLGTASTSPGSAQPFSTQAWTRDAAGRPTTIAEDGAAPVPVTYDARGRLTNLGGQAFVLDAAGRLTTLRDRILDYDQAGRLRSAGSGAASDPFTYDAAGNRLTGGGMTATWSGGRLVAVGTTAGTTTYQYDGDGMRTSAADPDGTIRTFDWSPGPTGPLLLSDGRSRFVYGPGGVPLEQIAADGTVAWFHVDPSGNVRALSGEDGRPVATFAWDAYGMPTGRTGTVDTPLGFHGRYTEPVSGLQLLPARAYDPGTGQLLGLDPSVMATHHPYAFAANDPLDLTDPSGAAPVPSQAALLAAGANDFIAANADPATAYTVLAGHGVLQGGSGRFQVPAGTTIVFHSPAGTGITDELGWMVERGQPTPMETRYGPGSWVPDYTLAPPTGLVVMPTSITVEWFTSELHSLLKPNMGTVHWAACRSADQKRTFRVEQRKDGTKAWVLATHPGGPVWDVDQRLYRDATVGGSALVDDPAWFDWDSLHVLPGA
ncbi:MAG: DUF6531 domain-containing protein [Chloroflexota bacterium]